MRAICMSGLLSPHTFRLQNVLPRVSCQIVRLAKGCS
jgi:hypothetical protein